MNMCLEMKVNQPIRSDSRDWWLDRLSDLCSGRMKSHSRRSCVPYIGLTILHAPCLSTGGNALWDSGSCVTDMDFQPEEMPCGIQRVKALTVPPDTVGVASLTWTNTSQHTPSLSTGRNTLWDSGGSQGLTIDAPSRSFTFHRRKRLVQEVDGLTVPSE